MWNSCSNCLLIEHVPAFAVLQGDHRRAVVEDRLELLLAAAQDLVGGAQAREKLPSTPRAREGGAARHVADHATLFVLVTTVTSANSAMPQVAAASPPGVPNSIATNAIGSV